MTKATLIRTTFNWGWLTSSEVQSIIIEAETWPYPGRCNIGAAESSTSCSEGRGEEYHPQAAMMRVLNPMPMVTHFL